MYSVAAKVCGTIVGLALFFQTGTGVIPARAQDNTDNSQTTSSDVLGQDSVSEQTFYNVNISVTNSGSDLGSLVANDIPAQGTLEIPTFYLTNRSGGYGTLEIVANTYTRDGEDMGIIESL